MRTPIMGDIVTVAIIEPSDKRLASHRVVEVPAIVTTVGAPVDDADAWRIGATTFKTADYNHEQIYASITLYASAQDGRATEDSQPVFAYIRSETVDDA